ncbi:unnamed protein product [Rotaria sp. Silwood1]|nr:unnamed protein product [Rotaria sp. Silwood1]CAF3542315.1 unnamed protein product [Rotaria sp. Silwood1]CAF4690498.1 unnamed protein product [Rotaria sp. Silwood1]
MYKTVDVGNNQVRSQLQALLDRAPHLYSLKITSLPCFQMLVVDIRSSTLRRLDLQEYDACLYDERWFNDDQCVRLCHSLIVKQCEVLRIRVEHRTSILDLINRMINLRALEFECSDDRWHKCCVFPSLLDDEYVEWLTDRMPSTWNITRNTRLIDSVQHLACRN